MCGGFESEFKNSSLSLWQQSLAALFVCFLSKLFVDLLVLLFEICLNSHFSFDVWLSSLVWQDPQCTHHLVLLSAQRKFSAAFSNSIESYQSHRPLDSTDRLD